MTKILPQRSAPTVVEGTIQYRLPIDPADYDMLRPEIRSQLSLSEQDLLSAWVEFCKTALWRLPQVQLMPRIRKLYQEGVPYDSIVVDVDHFLGTAEQLAVITPSEKASLQEIWQIRPQSRFFDELDNYALKQNFWGIQYLDYHINFVDTALKRAKITQEQADTIIKALLALSPVGLTLPTVRKTINDILGDNLGYSRIQKDLESMYVNVGGAFINVYDPDAISSDLDNLRGMGKVLAPGFDVVPLDTIRLIDLDKLAIYNVPEISVEALRNVVSFGGALGQGNVIKTHSLFPGEKAVLTIESFSKEASSYVLTSSVLDSTSNEAENSLAREVGATNSWNKESSRTSSFSVGIEAKASWGTGSAGGSANYSGSASDLSKSASSSLEKAVRNQANKVSNNRSVKIDTTSTRTTESSLRQSVVRTIENINVSRPLNFVFRQLTQEILTLFTTRDIRVSMRPSVVDNGKVGQLQEIPDLLRNYFFIEKVPDDLINKYYTSVVNCARDLGGQDMLNNRTEFLESYPTSDPKSPRFRVNNLRGRKLPTDSLTRINSDLSSLSKEFEKENGVYFDGYLNDVTRYVIKTEGVYVDCFLSETEGLDEYSSELQIQAIEQKKLDNAITSAKVDALSLAGQLVKSATTVEEKLRAFEQIVVPTLRAITNNDDEQ